MFYSQTFLARKGPLGTVWCAAHLQSRLKKSHYTSTNVSATVDLIMFPKVPLALRLSSHLLLGVVRIYSKQVDYLVRDCNIVITGLRKFAAVEVNLPEDARQAPVESVTLPEALNLDDFNFDDTLEGLRKVDNHLKSQEEITLEDQIPTDTDPYVAVTFDEDLFPDSRPMDVDSQSTMPVVDSLNHEEAGATQPVQDTQPIDHLEMPNVEVDPQVPYPDNQTEELRNSPEIEKMRDAGHELSPGVNPPFCPTQSTATVEPTECLNQTLNGNENSTPVIEEEMFGSGGNSSFQHRAESPAFVALEEGPENFGHSSPQLALRSTPPSIQQQPEPRPRKRKLFDKATVLTNKFMKQRLEDCSDILRKKRQKPSFALGIWKLNNRSRNEQMFQEPLLTGFSEDLHSVFKSDYITSKPQLVLVEEAESTQVLSPIRETENEAIPEFTSVQSPNSATAANPDDRVPRSPIQETEAASESRVLQSPNSANEEATVARSFGSFGNDDMEIESLRDGGLHAFTNCPTGFSPARTSDFTPQVGSAGTTTTPGYTAETAPYETDIETPRTIPEDLLGLGISGLSNIPEADEELSFLEAANETPTSSQASQGGGAASSVRTRALARYLKGCSSSFPTSEGPSEDLSLSKILEGKTRKLAARMFFETLVLKTNRLVDVQQDQPYADISLTLTPALLSKAQL